MPNPREKIKIYASTTLEFVTTQYENLTKIKPYKFELKTVKAYETQNKEATLPSLIF